MCSSKKALTKFWIVWLPGTCTCGCSWACDEEKLRPPCRAKKKKLNNQFRWKAIIAHRENINLFNDQHKEYSHGVLQFDKLTLVFSCVCPVIDHEFRRNIAKVAVDLRGDSRVDPQTTLTMLWRNSLSITGQTHWKLTSICFFLL